MIRRRDFSVGLGSAASSWSLEARAQQRRKVPRVAILTIAETDATPTFDAFRKGLRDLGYVEQKTIILDFLFANGNADALTAVLPPTWCESRLT